MKKQMTLAIMVAVAFPLVAFAQSEGYYDRSYIRLSYVKGDVFIQRGQDLGYEQGEVNLVVVEGDKLGTRDGRAELQLGRGNLLRLDLNSQVDIAGLPGRDEDPTKLHVLNGSVFLRVRTLDREKNIEIHTPDASFYVLEPGLYRVDILENRETEFSVIDGQAEAAGEEGSLLVRNGETITVADGRFISEPSRLQARQDNFDAWNASRDGLYASSLGRTYLPASYVEYDYELANYGRWAYESDYGYVWVPSVYSDWRPYYNGRWTWYPVIGWTWISYEPWGWCTHHYGRWGWRFGLGWYWIPTRHWGWGPAWVHWYHGRNHIGWCALSYHDYPGVIINNRFYDRYNRGYFPHDSRTLMVVHRDQLQNRRLSGVLANDRTIRDLGQISLRSGQPDVRPSLNRDSGVAAQARKVLNRESLRSVNKGFSAEGRRLSPGQLRSAPIRKSESGDLSRGRAISGRETGITRQSLSPGRTIEERKAPSPGPAVDRPARPRIGGTTDGEPARSSNRTVQREGMRVFPSRSDQTGASGSSRPSVSNREVSPSRLRTNPAPRTGDANRSVRSDIPSRTIRERSGSSGSVSSAIRRSTSSSGGSVSRNIEVPPRSLAGSSRSSSSVPRSYSPPARSSSLPSRSMSAPTRSSSAPSRSSSSSSRSYAAPSRSSSSPARSYSAPSRSSSSPSRSMSAPTRSSSAPSRSSSSSGRSMSAPSRNSGSSSRSSSSSGSSRSSGGSRSSGSVRRK